MICPNCGREIPDGTLCPCTLEAAPPPLSDNPALNAIKTVGSSSLFLALAILFSASALLSIFSSVWTTDSLTDFYYYAYSVGMDMNSISYLMDVLRSSAVAGAVLGSIPAILTAVAAWIHYGTCRNTQSGNISTAGLTIYKVLRYIALISMCLVTVLLVGLCIICIILVITGDLSTAGLFGYGPYSVSGEEVELALIMLFAVVAAFSAFFMALAIAYQASIIRMINRTKIIAATGIADDRVSGYFIGMNYVLAAIYILFGITGMALSPIAGITSLVLAAGLIVESLLLARYRTAMNLVVFPPVAPPVPPQIYGIPQPEAPVPPAGNSQQPPAEDQPPAEEELPPQ